MRTFRRPLFLMSLLAACTLMLTGCFTTTYTTGMAPGGAANETSNTHLILGLVTISDGVDLDALCPGGVAEIQIQRSFLDGLIGAIVGVIYSPNTTTVTCAGGASYKLDADQVNTLAAAE